GGGARFGSSGNGGVAMDRRLAKPKTEQTETKRHVSHTSRARDQWHGMADSGLLEKPGAPQSDARERLCWLLCVPPCTVDEGCRSGVRVVKGGPSPTPAAALMPATGQWH